MNDLQLSSALVQVLVRFHAMIVRVGTRHGLDPADVDEVVQEVRLRLWKALRTSENIEGVPASYVYRTATAAALDLLRRRRRKEGEVSIGAAGHAQAALGESSDRPDRNAGRAELAAAIEQALRTLSDSRRPIVRMHLAGYNRAEISSLMGWTEAKTRNLLYRGLSDLRDALLSRGVGPGTVP